MVGGKVVVAVSDGDGVATVVADDTARLVLPGRRVVWDDFRREGHEG